MLQEEEGGLYIKYILRQVKLFYIFQLKLHMAEGGGLLFY
jgi:hypothetical protein